MWLIILAVLIVLFTAFYLHVSYKMSYWKRLGVAEEPGFFPFGSQSAWDFYTQKKAFTEQTDSAYKNYKNNKVVGSYQMLGDPRLIVRDLEIAKRILIKDFDCFTDRMPEGNGFAAPGSKNNKYFVSTVFTLRGEKWKHMRAILSPVFTSGKLKGMVSLIHKVADACILYLQPLCGEDVEAKYLMRDFSFDVIASTGFGLDIDSFKDPENSFKKFGDKVVGKTMSWKDFLAFLFIFISPSLQKILDIPLVNPEAMEFFANVIRESIKERKKDGVRRNDLIDLVIDVMDKEKQQDADVEKDTDQYDVDAMLNYERITNKLSDEELENTIISNSLLLFTVGFDTTSSTSSLIMYFLAKNPDVQQKLFEEISKAVEENGDEKLGYETVMKLPYLDMVFNETLRLYAIGGHLERAASKNYKIPDTDIVIPKGTLVMIAVQAIMKDEQFYPNPEKFNPENFSASAKSARSPYTFAGFGHGPRNCIGMRFALMQVKIAISRLLLKYKVLPCDKTVPELIPDPVSPSLQPKGGIYLKYEKRM